MCGIQVGAETSLEWSSTSACVFWKSIRYEDLAVAEVGHWVDWQAQAEVQDEQRKVKEAKAKQRAYDDLLGWTVKKQRGIYRCFPGRQIEMGGHVAG